MTKASRAIETQKEVVGAADNTKNPPQGEQKQKKHKWSKRQSPSLYLILTIGPGGFKFSDIRFAKQKPDPRSITRGEGQCLVFKLNNWDASTLFADALFDGRVYDYLKDKIFEFDFDDTKTRDPMEQLEVLDAALKKVRKSDG